MRRLEAKGRGILLLHDIHPATAMALPVLLKELKAQGLPCRAGGGRRRAAAIGARTGGLAARARAPGRRVLQASAASERAPPSALRHRIKNALARKRHRGGARKRYGIADHRRADDRRSARVSLSGYEPTAGWLANRSREVRLR